MKKTKDFINKLKNSKILKTGSLSLLCTVLVKAVNLISIPVFSRLLTTSEYGKADVFMTYVNIFMIILGLDFAGAVGKGRLDFEEDGNEYITSSLLFTTLFSVGVVLIINILFPIFQIIFGMDRLTVNIMLLYSYAMFVIAYRSAEFNFYYEYKKNMAMSLSIAIGNFAFSIILIKTIFAGQKFWGRIFGAAIPTLTVAFFVYWYLLQRGRWIMRKKYVKYSLKFGVPLIPHNLSHMVLSSADKVMINSMISSSASGIYSLVYTLGMLTQVVFEAMNNVFGPWLFRQLKKREEHNVRYVQKYYLLVYCIVTVGVLTISPEIIKIIGPKEYWEGISMVMWVVYAAFINFTYTLYVNVEFFYGKTMLISVGTIMAALINVFLNLFFLQEFGYQFGAISTTVSYVALLIFHMFIVNFILKKNVTDNIFVILVVLFMLGTTLCLHSCLNSLLQRVLLGVCAELVILGIVYFLYKKYGKPDLNLE
ncbi:MAG: oligosaccharide flippase family protein [Dorea sp.]|nr:oligosaccharide flippase family protein [Dorea sp.]